MTIPFPRDKRPKEKICHGCGGKGWVDTRTGARTCPVCHGRGKLYEKEPKWKG